MSTADNASLAYADARSDRSATFSPTLSRTEYERIYYLTEKQYRATKKKNEVTWVRIFNRLVAEAAELKRKAALEGGRHIKNGVANG